jgi:hypothetical protein
VSKTKAPAAPKAKKRVGCNTYMAGLFIIFVVVVGVILWSKAH